MNARQNLGLLGCLAAVSLCCCGVPSGEITATGDADIHDPYLDLDYGRTQLSSGENFQITYVPTPDPIPLEEYFDVLVTVSQANSPLQLISPDELSVTAWMPGHGHGMNAEPTIEELSEGRYQATAMHFMMEHHWQIWVDTVQNGEEERTIFQVMCCE